MNLLKRIGRRVEKSVSSLLFLDQWVILTGQGMDYDSLDWDGLQPLIPAKDRYWADPFVVARDGRYYVFIEEKIYATGLGRISCLTLNEQGRLLSTEVVLQRSYHLSYPFLFEYDGELFMLPETAQHRTIELYRCVSFPARWEPAQTLISGVYAVDATLLEQDGRWWLFANVKEAGGSSLDALYLYHADTPLTDRWIPHPENPVVHDIRSARPAGRIFKDGPCWIRPAQDNSRRYGRALKFQRILKLNEKEYAEKDECAFEPPRSGRLRATHTFNQAGRLTVIDAVVRRGRFGG